MLPGVRCYPRRQRHPRGSDRAGPGDLRPGRPDYAIEAVGSARTIEQALGAAESRRDGRRHLDLAGGDMRSRLTPRCCPRSLFTGWSFGGSRQLVDLPGFVDLFMEGRYTRRELVSRRIGLDDLNDAHVALERGGVRRSVIAYGSQ